ncbi:MAG: signal recognition particle receptor subunit alpha, partial [Rhodanobacter sp.]
MHKFWKKKPAEAESSDPDAKPTASEPAADASGISVGDSALGDALADFPAPATSRTGTGRSQMPELPQTGAPAATRSWRDRLSGSAFSRSLGSLFVRHPQLDDDLLDELETILISADVGVEASTALAENLRKRMHKREFADAPALLAALRQALVA